MLSASPADAVAVLQGVPQHYKDICTKIIEDLERATTLATTVAPNVSKKLEPSDREIDDLNAQAASLMPSNQGKAKKLLK